MMLPFPFVLFQGEECVELDFNAVLFIHDNVA